MPIECYAMVVVEAPMTKEQRIDAKLIRDTRRALKEYEQQRDDGSGFHRATVAITALSQELDSLPSVSRDVVYHCARLVLTQPAGRKGSVPKPKWEIAETLFVLSDRKYYQWDVGQYTDLPPGAEWPLDPYNDIYLTGVEPNIIVRVPDYKATWEALLDRVEPDQEGEVVECHPAGEVGPDWLPVGHPVEPDRRVQLRQIRYLFPETATMPFPVALDYLRDRI